VVHTPRRYRNAGFPATTRNKTGEMRVMSQHASTTLSSATDSLPRRERTRLWYRAESHTALEDHLISEQPSGEHVRGTGRLPRTGQLRALEALQATLNQDDTEASATETIEITEALTDWRDSPRHCPVLLLSASPLLDARNPGPLLGPGTRYRIVTVEAGLVCLQVDALDGRVGVGYCNAVDLMCYEPEIMYLRHQKRTGRLQTAKLSLSRLSQRITGGTGSLSS
jgi:hypothetical protein